MSDLSAWWDGLTTLQSVYWLIAIPCTIVFFILMLMSLFGGDTDADGIDLDTEIDSDFGIGFQFFTLKNLVGFLTIFSWSGIACLEAEMSVPLSLIVSFCCGLLMMTVMATLFYLMKRMQDSGTLNINNAIDGVGEVYLNINANRGNIGKVHIKIQGALRELDALTDDESNLNRGDVVTVVDVVNDHLLLVSRSNK